MSVRVSKGCHHVSVVSCCVFLFAWQVMAEGDQSASAAQARSLSGSKHIGQWLLSKVLDK